MAGQLEKSPEKAERGSGKPGGNFVYFFEFTVALVAFYLKIRFS
jgi:hypothetical protein